MGCVLLCAAALRVHAPALQPAGLHSWNGFATQLCGVAVWCSCVVYLHACMG